MPEPAGLRGHRAADALVGVPEQVGPPGTDGVEITVTVVILEPHPGSAPHRDRRQRFVILHLRARMPHVAQIARRQRGIVLFTGVHAGILASWAASCSTPPILTPSPACCARHARCSRRIAILGRRAWCPN